MNLNGSSLSFFLTNIKKKRKYLLAKQFTCLNLQETVTEAIHHTCLLIPPLSLSLVSRSPSVTTSK